jgi:hypothetical protein
MRKTCIGPWCAPDGTLEAEALLRADQSATTGAHSIIRSEKLYIIRSLTVVNPTVIIADVSVGTVSRKRQ